MAQAADSIPRFFALKPEVALQIGPGEVEELNLDGSRNSITANSGKAAANSKQKKMVRGKDEKNGQREHNVFEVFHQTAYNVYLCCHKHPTEGTGLDLILEGRNFGRNKEYLFKVPKKLLEDKIFEIREDQYDKPHLINSSAAASPTQPKPPAATASPAALQIFEANTYIRLKDGFNFKYGYNQKSQHIGASGLPLTSSGEHQSWNAALIIHSRSRLSMTNMYTCVVMLEKVAAITKLLLLYQELVYLQIRR